MSSKKGKSIDKQVKDVSARPSTSSTSPQVERVRSHAPALPRASEHQVDEQEIGLPCPISFGVTREPSSPRGPPLSTPPVSRAPKAANLAQGKAGQTSPWVVPLNQQGSMLFPGQQWMFPPSNSNASGQHPYNMAAPMPPQVWPLSWYNAAQQWPPNVPQVNQQHQDNPATPRQLLPPPPVSPIVWGTNSIARQDFESTSDMARMATPIWSAALMGPTRSI